MRKVSRGRCLAAPFALRGACSCASSSPPTPVSHVALRAVATKHACRRLALAHILDRSIVWVGRGRRKRGAASCRRTRTSASHDETGAWDAAITSRAMSEIRRRTPMSYRLLTARPMRSWASAQQRAARYRGGLQRGSLPLRGRRGGPCHKRGWDCSLCSNAREPKVRRHSSCSVWRAG